MAEEHDDKPATQKEPPPEQVGTGSKPATGAQGIASDLQRGGTLPGGGPGAGLGSIGTGGGATGGAPTGSVKRGGR
jgi:hypothetical protein